VSHRAPVLPSHERTLPDDEYTLRRFSDRQIDHFPSRAIHPAGAANPQSLPFFHRGDLFDLFELHIVGIFSGRGQRVNDCNSVLALMSREEPICLADKFGHRSRVQARAWDRLSV
jgi:hypothetical protein